MTLSKAISAVLGLLGAHIDAEAHGAPARGHALGRFEIVGNTKKAAAAGLGLDWNAAKLDAATQDKMQPRELKTAQSADPDPGAALRGRVAPSQLSSHMSPEEINAWNAAHAKSPQSPYGELYRPEIDTRSIALRKSR